MPSLSDHRPHERPRPDEDQNQARPITPPDENHSSAAAPLPSSAGHQDANPNNYPHEPVPGYPPPVMGYPPAYPPPHNGGGGYHYGTPQPQVEYYATNNPHYYSSQVPPMRTSGFARGVLAVLIILVLASGIITVVTCVVLRPQIPEFDVTSFSVTNFNISNSVLMGIWDANVTVNHNDHKLKASFDRIQSFVYYEDLRNYLTWTTEPSFSLETKTSSVISVKMSMIDGEQPSSSTLAEMSEERQKGTVVFGLGFGLMGTFKSAWWWTNNFGMRVYCEDLAVGFVGASGTGSLKDQNPKRCFVNV